jgi:long-chain acyl-CoA synthetase
MDPERIAGRTTVGVFFRQAALLGDRTLIRHHDGRAWREVSWAEMRKLVLRVAAGLIDAGVEPGDRVAIMATNRLQWLCCDLGIMTAGGVTVPIYPSSTTATARLIVEDCGARLAFAGDAEIAERLAPCRTVLMDGELDEWLARDLDPEARTAIDCRLAVLAPDHLCTIVYTSGTTGEPKGVMLAHRSLVDMARSCLQVFDIGPDDQSLSFLPYAHVFERINGIYLGMMAGASTWISRGIDRLADDLQECRPTVMVSVPRVYEKMHQAVLARVAAEPTWRRTLFRWALEQGRRKARGQLTLQHGLADRLVLVEVRRALTGGRLRFFVSGGAALSREVEEFFWAIGVKILQGWGLTETSSGACSNTEQRHKFETVGPPLPGVEVRISDDGEIMVRGPGNMVGYHRNPSATAEVLEDGWLRTGDLGELDADGFLRITDRKKDLIKTAGGKYIAPQPLETRLQRESIIERAVVIGDERPYAVALILPDWRALEREEGLSGVPERLVADERVRAAIQRRVDALNRDLASWETIKAFALLARDFTEASGELTPTLKVRRRVVGERFRDVVESLYAHAGIPSPAGAPLRQRGADGAVG